MSRDEARLQRRVDGLEALQDELPLIALVRVATPQTPDEPFAVLHGLGAVPNEVSWTSEDFVQIRTSEEDKRSWDSRFISLRCSVAGAVIDFTIRVNRGL